MGFRLFTTLCLILIVAALAGALTDLGWVPWALACAAVVMALVGGGLRARRRRGTQTTLAPNPRAPEGAKAIFGQNEDEAPPAPQ